MKNPESHDPRNTSNAAHQCPLGLRRFSPNRNSPRNADSRKKANTPFHRQGLADHAAREAREVRPVRAELKFHGDAGDHAQHEIDAEDLGPETRRLVVDLDRSVRSARVFSTRSAGARPIVSCGNR